MSPSSAGHRILSCKCFLFCNRIQDSDFSFRQLRLVCADKLQKLPPFRPPYESWRENVGEVSCLYLRRSNSWLDKWVYPCLEQNGECISREQDRQCASSIQHRAPNLLFRVRRFVLSNQRLASDPRTTPITDGPHHLVSSGSFGAYVMLWVRDPPMKFSIAVDPDGPWDEFFAFSLS